MLTNLYETEMALHGESHMATGMLGAMAPANLMELYQYQNPNHVVMPAPQLNHVDIPEVNPLTHDLEGYKVMVIKDAADLTNPFEVSPPSPVVGEYEIPEYDHMDQLIGYIMKKDVASATPGVKTNPYDVVMPAPVHDFVADPMYNHEDQLIGYDVKPSLMELAAKKCKNKNNVAKPAKVKGDKRAKECFDKVLTGWTVEPKQLMELHKKKMMMKKMTMKPKKTNPFHVAKPAPVVGFKDIAQYNHKKQLIGYDVKPKMIMMI